MWDGGRLRSAGGVLQCLSWGLRPVAAVVAAAGILCSLLWLWLAERLSRLLSVPAWRAAVGAGWAGAYVGPRAEHLVSLPSLLLCDLPALSPDWLCWWCTLTAWLACCTWETGGDRQVLPEGILQQVVQLGQVQVLYCRCGSERLAEWLQLTLRAFIRAAST